MAKLAIAIILNQNTTSEFIMKDDECLEEVTITVFPPMPGIGIVEEAPFYEDEESCGDSSITQIPIPSSSDSDVKVLRIGEEGPMGRINILLEKAESEFGDSICIRIATYDDNEQIEEAREWLNAALRGSGNTSVSDEAAFSAFLGTSAPLISINNRLSFVGMIPNENQFLSRIRSNLRMTKG